MSNIPLTDTEKVVMQDRTQKEEGALEALFQPRPLIEDERELRLFLFVLKWLTSILCSIPAGVWIYAVVVSVFEDKTMFAHIAAGTAGAIVVAMLEFAKYGYGTRFFRSVHARNRTDRASGVAYFGILLFSILTTVPGAMYLADASIDSESEVNENLGYRDMRAREAELVAQISSLTKQAEGIDGKYIQNNQTREKILAQIPPKESELAQLRMSLAPIVEKVKVNAQAWIIYVGLFCLILELVHVWAFNAYILRLWLAYKEMVIARGGPEAEALLGSAQQHGAAPQQQHGAAPQQQHGAAPQQQHGAAPQHDFDIDELAKEIEADLNGLDIKDAVEPERRQIGYFLDIGDVSGPATEPATDYGSSDIEVFAAPPPLTQHQPQVLLEQHQPPQQQQQSGQHSLTQHRRSTADAIVFDPDNNEWITLERARSRMRAAKSSKLEWIERQANADNTQEKTLCIEKTQKYGTREETLAQAIAQAQQ